MAHSLEEAIALFDPQEEIFIIGGAQIYAQALPLAHRIYLTVVERDYQGDTSFPEIDYSVWRQTSREDFTSGEEFEHPFSFITLER